ncbi:transglycosylase family protein [Zhihengliuella sp.]|uniref:transglycosylase family protein n=1 Tax=Zhihengliuella sp. TaxID=1954483 RepID=UPI00281179FE|nr:transglycosylase family protein [Zhihengliuella sp.]
MFRNRWAKVAAQAVVLTALILGVVAYVGASKTIDVTVDGETQSVTTFGGTVADALEASEIELAANDEVAPALDAAIDDGSTVTVNRHKTVEVMIDGEKRTVGTTGLTVADVMKQLGVNDEAEISLGSGMELASLSTPIEVQTPKSVTLTVGGEEQTLQTTGLTIADALADAEIEVGEADIVEPADTATALEDGTAITVVRVTTETRTATEAIPHETEKVEDSSMDRGDTEVETEGVDGVREITSQVTLHDGEVESTEVVDTKVAEKPVTEVIKVGTKREEPKPEPKSSSSSSSSSSGGTTASGPSSGAWAALAKCESGGNWSINTGNGYYGGLQFSASSWAAAGGTQYAPLPHQASPSEQIATAERLRANGGWGHWPHCSAKLGLR